MRSPCARAWSKSRTATARRSCSTGAAERRGFLAGKRNSEQLTKAVLAGGGDLQCARIAQTRDPAELEAAAGKRGAERAGKMQPPLAPIDAGTAEGAAAAADIVWTIRGAAADAAREIDFREAAGVAVARHE